MGGWDDNILYEGVQPHLRVGGREDNLLYEGVPPQLGVEALPPELELEMRRAMSLTPSIQERSTIILFFHY